jgi:thioredoxin reductase (NADPH)
MRGGHVPPSSGVAALEINMMMPRGVGTMADWDVVIIGGGPAGLSAGAAAAKAGLSTVIIDRMGGGGELMNLGTLLDMKEAITGPDLAARLLDEAATAGAELGIGEVTQIKPDGELWQILTDQEQHRARAILIAVGRAPGTLGLPNEDRFEGRGLSHCGACDGPLFSGQPVVVAGNDRWARHEARDLVATCSTVTLVGPGVVQRADDGVVALSGRITALEGENGLTAVQVQPEDGSAPVRLPAEAVFVQANRQPNLSFVTEHLARDRDGFIVTRHPGQCSLQGLFAAGDVCSEQGPKVASAIASGRAAAASVCDTLRPLGKSPE